MLDVIEVVRSVVEHSGDNEGAFPSRSKLLWFLLIHLKNQISPLEMLDPSRFWRGIDASLADKWSTESGPSLFPLLGDQLRLAEPVLLQLLRKARLGVHCGVSHSEVHLQLHKPRRMEFGQSTDWELSSVPTIPMEVHRPRLLLHV